MKLTRAKVTEIWNVLSNFKGTYNKTFSMYLVLNQKRLKSVIEEIGEIQKLVQPSEQYKELQNKEMEIINKYVERDENNKPVLFGNTSFKIRQGEQDNYNDEITEFRKENEEIINEIKTNRQQFETLMNEEIEVDLMQIPFNSFPEEMDVNVLGSLSEVIKDFDNIEDQL